MNVYIWKDYNWTPGVNTIAYYPFRSDILDHSGNNRNLTGSGYSFANNRITLTSSLTGPLIVPTSGTEPRTIISWIAYNSSSSGGLYFFANGSSGPNGALVNNTSTVGLSLKIGNTWYNNQATPAQTFDCVVLIKDGNKLIRYINGASFNEVTISTDQWSFYYPTTYSSFEIGTYGETIVEDKVRTAEEVLDYYNSTKSNYGIS